MGLLQNRIDGIQSILGTADRIDLHAVSGATEDPVAQAGVPKVT
jgi:hypothetical protein